jgi:hypothetical protein
MGTDVNLSALESVARALRSGGSEVEESGRNAPSEVDAGDMTGFVLAVLGTITDQAATLCEGLNNAATAVSDSHATYVATEKTTVQRFQGLA